MTIPTFDSPSTERPIADVPITTVAVPVEPLFSDEERSALVGFLAGYTGQTRVADKLAPVVGAWHPCAPGPVGAAGSRKNCRSRTGRRAGSRPEPGTAVRVEGLATDRRLPALTGSGRPSMRP